MKNKKLFLLLAAAFLLFGASCKGSFVDPGMGTGGGGWFSGGDDDDDHNSGGGTGGGGNGGSHETAIPLTLNTWADGNIPTSSGEQWFSFTATDSTQYIHVNFGTVTALYVQLYYSNVNAFREGGTLSSTSETKYISQSVTSGQMYYIKVRPSEYVRTSGTYKIGFTTSTTPPSN